MYTHICFTQAYMYVYIRLTHMSSIEQVLVTTPHKTPTIRTLAPHHENYTSKMNQTRGTLLEKQG